MKLTTVVLTLATAGTLVAAQPHRHNHRHVKRSPDEAYVPVSTVIVYELYSTPVPANEVCKGIEDGSLEWKDGNAPHGACAPPAATLSSTAIPTSTASEGAQFYETSASPTTTSEPASSAAPTSSSAPSSSSSGGSDNSGGGGNGGSSGGQGVDSEFPDGELDCSTFPSKYGPVSVDWMGLGGWSGVQYVTISGNAVTNINTAVSGQGCEEGAMCSYACPPGYQKSQWPETQGSTGQSVGGLSCSGGKLHLTNSGLSTKLCIPGTGNVNAQNKLSKVVNICRTDYPGTESETVPVGVDAGETQPLTCPDAGKYFSWKGMPTSAQYYVNPSGVQVSDACQWGSPSNPWGNFAPVNLGVGTKDGATYISIMANKPTTDAILDFDIEIVGDNLGGSCSYSGGVFTGATGSNGDGCTVQVMSGSATYVFK